MSLSSRSVEPDPACTADLPALHALEAALFPPERQESLGGIKRSLASPHQEVWVIREGDILISSMTLRLYPKSLRVYSLAIARQHQGRGLGEVMMKKAASRARALGKSALRLEADANNARLIQWYLGQGYHFLSVLPDYYGPGTAAQRMVKSLENPHP
jgi:[ribosomal protein S18]-alanine N-acetyltransferase